MTNIKDSFIKFFFACPIRRTFHQKAHFLKDYLAIFRSYGYDIHFMKDHIRIGDVENAKFLISARYDTDRLLIFKTRRYYYDQKTIKHFIFDQWVRIILLSLGYCLLLFLSISIYLNFVIIIILFWLLIHGLSNRYTFSLTIPLFVIKQLIPYTNYSKHAFVLYDRKFDKNSICRNFINLERIGAGSFIAVNDNDKTVLIGIDDELDLLYTFKDKHQININVGFVDQKGFYQMHLDSNEDASFNIAIYYKIMNILNYFIK
ncbi:MAG: hypothetical protein PHP11_01380 [Erysipelotrichaceae bacterium]|nr:hypothetical protein [Erysipelotrichaceae bacterium]